MTGTALQQAHYSAERIRQHVEKLTVSYHSQKIRFTISIGLGGTEEKSLSFDQLVALTDRKLYQAKSEGRNRVAF
jgi:diguanylate cyclase (GGDEF)-like protein